ncbi:MAG: hypothetical protein ACLUE1_00720 [Adlercreutzia equolifaciens]
MGHAHCVPRAPARRPAREGRWRRLSMDDAVSVVFHPGITGRCCGQLESRP